MSDIGRKGFTEQTTDKLKPDSQKTATEKLGDQASSTYDRAAGALQPEYVYPIGFFYQENYTNSFNSSQKSTTQKAGDSLRSGKDDTSDTGKGIGQNISEGLSSATQSAKDTVNNLTGK